MQKKYLLIILVSLFLKQAQGLEAPTNKVSEPQEFKEDCPDNSRCSKKGAEAFRIWSETLKNNHSVDLKILKNLEHRWGVPLNFWSTKKIIEKNENKLSLLSWDSACPNHQLPEKEISISTLFVSDFSEKNVKSLEEKGFLTDIATVKISPQKFMTWKIPRGDTPLYLDNQGGLFIRDIEGAFFYYHLSKGGLRITPQDEKVSGVSRAISINCPEDLSKFFNEHLPKSNLFTGSFCKSIWDVDAKIYRDVMFTKACP